MALGGAKGWANVGIQRGWDVRDATITRGVESYRRECGQDKSVGGVLFVSAQVIDIVLKTATKHTS